MTTKESFFIPENLQPNLSKTHLSPSEKYRLIIDTYSTKKGSWGYTQGSVFLQNSDNPITVVQRNYSSFPFTFVEGNNGKDYLVCGEDYQGQTIVCLNTGERVNYSKDGFCWACIHPSPDGKTLAVEGCYWGAPYEVRFYDFTNPMESLPQLSDGLKDHERADSFFGWNENNTASFGTLVDVRSSDGKPLNELTPEEIDALLYDDAPDDLTSEKEMPRTWIHP